MVINKKRYLFIILLYFIEFIYNKNISNNNLIIISDNYLNCGDIKNYLYKNIKILNIGKYNIICYDFLHVNDILMDYNYLFLPSNLLNYKEDNFNEFSDIYKQNMIYGVIFSSIYNNNSDKSTLIISNDSIFF